MCQLLGVTRSGYCGYQRRNDGRPDSYHLELLEAVKDIAEATEYSYGSRRMKHALNALSYPVSRHKARQLMKEACVQVKHSKEERKRILSLHHQRKLSKNLTIQFRHTGYQLQGYGQGYCLRGTTITVCEDFNGSVTLLHKGKTLAYRTLRQGEAAVMIADSKTVHNHVEQILHQQQQKSTWKPAPDHPWRRPLTRSLTNTALY